MKKMRKLVKIKKRRRKLQKKQNKRRRQKKKNRKRPRKTCLLSIIGKMISKLLLKQLQQNLKILKSR